MKEGSAQHDLIVQEAIRAGMQVEDHSQKDHAQHILRSQTGTFTLVQGVIQEWINPKATVYCDQKQLTKDMLESLQIPHPKSVLFHSQDELKPALFTQGKTYICKPEVSTNGIGVAFDIRTKEDVETYLTHWRAEGPFLLEEFIEGYDLRIQVIGGKMVAACTRQPAEVQGNGKDSLEKLIATRRAQVIRKNAANRLDVDSETRLLLQAQGVDLHDVPSDGQVIRLKRIANMAQGASAVDCSDSIDPAIGQWIGDLCIFLHVPCFAIDILTPDIRDFARYKILELNLRAEWMHHTFSEGRQHDLAGIIVKELLQN